MRSFQKGRGWRKKANWSVCWPQKTPDGAYLLLLACAKSLDTHQLLLILESNEMLAQLAACHRYTDDASLP